MSMPNVSKQTQIDKDGSSIFERFAVNKLNLIEHKGNQDFGIDYSAEIMDQVKSCTTGQFINIQLKSHEVVQFNSEGYYNQSVKVTTANYWLEMNLPVLLVVVETSTGKIYSSDAKRMLRLTYDENKMNNQNSISIPVTQNMFEIDDAKRVAYQYNKYEFLLNISNDVVIIRSFFHYMQSHSYRDQFLEVEYDLSEHILYFASKYTLINVSNKKIFSLYQTLLQGYADFNKNYVEYQRVIFNEGSIIPYFKELINLIVCEISFDNTYKLKKKLKDFIRLKKEIDDNPIGISLRYWSDIKILFYEQGDE
ncbi:MAG: DUF4365 domain-containing protein [bacterium]